MDMPASRIPGKDESMLRYSSAALSSLLLLIRIQSDPVYRFIVEERYVDIVRAKEATYVPLYASEATAKAEGSSGRGRLD